MQPFIDPREARLAGTGAAQVAGPGVFEVFGGQPGEALFQPLQMLLPAGLQLRAIEVALAVLHGVANQQPSARQQAQGGAARQGRQHAPGALAEQVLPARLREWAGDAGAQFQREGAAMVHADPGQERPDAGQHLGRVYNAGFGLGLPATPGAAKAQHRAVLVYLHRLGQAVGKAAHILRRLQQCVATGAMDGAGVETAAKALLQRFAFQVASVGANGLQCVDHGVSLLQVRGSMHGKVIARVIVFAGDTQLADTLAHLLCGRHTNARSHGKAGKAWVAEQFIGRG
ncbi:hypothetical protein D3C79_672690 [compost metagenome]